jgi:lantibiotic modifying enzyme
MRQIALKQLARIQEHISGSQPKNDSFIGGALGLAFYYYHSYKVFEENRLGDRAQELIEEIFANIDSGSARLAGPAFSNGGAGLAYTINFLSREGFLDFDVDHEFEELHKYLYQSAVSQIEGDFLDYLHGAMGTVFYFSERVRTMKGARSMHAAPADGRSPSGDEGSPSGQDRISYYLDHLIEKICDKAILHESGCWFRNFMLQIQEKDEINFGLSHGLSGILLILINAYPQSMHKLRIERVVREGIRFIRKHKIDIDFTEKSYSFFPFLMRRDAVELVAPNRLAWCYGDLNEVLLFYRAGKLLGDDSLIRLAELVGMQTLLRKNEEMTMVTDSHFCHGSSGLAQFYKILFKESGQTAYLSGYEYCIEQTILLLDKDLEKGVFAGKECDYLEGLVGVGLTLLSYVSDQELYWSRSLLL